MTGCATGMHRTTISVPFCHPGTLWAMNEGSCGGQREGQGGGGRVEGRRGTFAPTQIKVPAGGLLAQGTGQKQWVGVLLDCS